jgi:hypothetical protein
LFMKTTSNSKIESNNFMNVPGATGATLCPCHQTGEDLGIRERGGGDG